MFQGVKVSSDQYGHLALECLTLKGCWGPRQSWMTSLKILWLLFLCFCFVLFFLGTTWKIELQERIQNTTNLGEPT